MMLPALGYPATSELKARADNLRAVLLAAERLANRLLPDVVGEVADLRQTMEILMVKPLARQIQMIEQLPPITISEPSDGLVDEITAVRDEIAQAERMIEGLPEEIRRVTEVGVLQPQRNRLARLEKMLDNLAARHRD